MRCDLTLALLCAASVPLGGCASYLVVAPEPRYAGQPHEEGANSMLWSAVTAPYPGVVAEPCGDGEQLAMVRVNRNFGQGLVTVLTLGLVSPVTVTYHCASPAPPPLGGFDTGGAAE